MPTNIKLDDSTWKRLNKRKEPGDTFDDVVVRFLNETSDRTDPHES